jgi:hypothetical protein
MWPCAPIWQCSKTNINQGKRHMTLDDIKAAVDAGQTVHWANTSYIVHKDRLGQYLITYVPNGSCIGLTDRSGHRLNGKETEFAVAGLMLLSVAFEYKQARE